MTNKEIFEVLFNLSENAGSSRGAVSACLVRGGEIIASAYSTDKPNRHAEDLLLEKIKNENINVEEDDILYVTIQPCGRRTPGGDGEQFGDCTTKIINSPIKNVIYAVHDPNYTEGVTEKLKMAGVISKIVDDTEITEKARAIFNSTLTDKDYMDKKGENPFL